MAKIEGGERAVRIDEATAIADLFEVSVDAMLGRTSNPSSDLLFKFRANLDVARQSAHSVWGIATLFRQRTEEVSAVDFEGWIDFRDRCRHAWDALNDAHRALIEVADFPVPSEAQLRPPDPQTVREQAELRALFKEVLEAGRNRDEA